MKITGATNTIINGIRPKVIETANGFLLNTQYYTKEKLAPVPFENCNMLGSPYSLSIRKFLSLISYSTIFSNDEIGILKDTTYSNRYYIRILDGYQTGSGSIVSYLYTIEETENGEIKILNNQQFSNHQFLEFVDQDDTFIYFTTRNTSENKCYLYGLNKTTFAFKNPYAIQASHNYTRIKKIYSDELYVYFMHFTNQNIYVVKINKNSNTVETSSPIYRGEETTDTSTYFLTNISDTVYQIDDTTYGLFFYNGANLEQPIDLYMYDTSKTLTEGFSMQHVTISWSGGKANIDFIFGTAGAGINTIVRNFISEFNGIKYLNIVVYQTNYANAAQIDYQGIYTFKINSESSLTFTGYNQIDAAKQIGGFIYDESKEHLIVAKLNAFQILKFNQTTLKYESTNFEITNCYSAGIDELQRIWYTKLDTSVHMINLEDAQSVEIEFEKEYYDYTGASINTYINFSAVNYLGNNFTGTFELTLSGPAVFTENSSTTLRFTYAGSGKQQIGLTITGASPITVYPKFIS